MGILVRITVRIAMGLLISAAGVIIGKNFKEQYDTSKNFSKDRPNFQEFTACYNALVRSDHYTFNKIYSMLSKEFNISPDDVKKYIKEIIQINDLE